MFCVRYYLPVAVLSDFSTGSSYKKRCEQQCFQLRMSIFKWYIWTVAPMSVTEFLVFDCLGYILFSSQVCSVYQLSLLR